jgi:hypothetical protein
MAFYFIKALQWQALDLEVKKRDKTGMVNPNWDKTIESCLRHFTEQEHYMMYKNKLKKNLGKDKE